MKKFSTLLFLFTINSFLFKTIAQVTLQQFSTGYTAPVEVENCDDSRLFIVQQSGQIIIADSLGNKRATPFIDISNRVLFDGERGLLGIAFDPDYATNRYFYVDYINKSGNTQISRFTTNKSSANVANPNTEKFILQVQQPFTNHKGGCIRFGADKYLYIGMGDGGSGGDPNNNAQNPASLLGKMLRIDVRHTNGYTIPPDNPYVDSINYKKEIWAFGLRNPWRWSFDQTSNSLIIADVGQDQWEEVDIQPANKGGINYGWRCYEGSHAYNTTGCKASSFYTLPVYEYQHLSTTGDCSIIGGFYYRGTKYNGLKGKYFFADYCSGLIRTRTSQGKVEIVYDGDNYAYTAFGEDKNHELYIVNAANGTIYHIIRGKAQNIADAPVATENNLSVSPNPSHGNFIMSYKADKAQLISIQIQNTLGQHFYVTTKNISAGVNNININTQLPGGEYYINVVNKEGKTISRQLRIQ